MTCKHCSKPIHLHPCGPGQVWLHDSNMFALCRLTEDCTTWAEPETADLGGSKR